MERSRSRSDGLGDIPIRDEQGCVVDGEGCGWGLGGDVVGLVGSGGFTHKKVLGIPFQRHFGALFLSVFISHYDVVTHSVPRLFLLRAALATAMCVHKRMA
jgi:hypothetical protein